MHSHRNAAGELLSFLLHSLSALRRCVVEDTDLDRDLSPPVNNNVHRGVQVSCARRKESFCMFQISMHGGMPIENFFMSGKMKLLKREGKES